ncbi:Transmembrane alpha-helix domain [Rhizoctonia solani]|uniref:Transmembrane alpha-helix domain n=1 Tax=Rhizoctonia solani TaxID=456999 RepID=A0A8H8NVF4_9AGAM|nr:Transmembrane alpha-helix domain [Rhizoctonia solani]QRW20245.1 Transmembrane alpha-helix domain [Rhizoctonia solani]
MSARNPPWDPSNFYFDTNALAVAGTIPQCSNATWEYWSINTANPLPKAPYHGVFYAGGYEPYRVQFHNRDLTGKLNWTANLPEGIAFGSSMFDSEDYTSGMLERTTTFTPQPGCNVTNPLTPSTLDVEVTGDSGQCQMSWINIKNGTPPYRLEIAPLGRHQKTIHFLTSPLIWGRALIIGWWRMIRGALGRSSTVTAGRFSTMYPGGTTTFTTSATATATSMPSNGLAVPAIIGVAVAVPIVSIIIIALLIFFCYKRHRRGNELEEKPDIEPVYYPGIQYTPVPTTGTSLTFAGSHHGGSSNGL